MHPTDAQLLVSFDAGHEGDAAVRAHVATCAPCGARQSELRAELRDTLASLADLAGPAPRPDPDVLIARARRRGRRRILARAAAVVALLAVAGTAAALPRSPLRRWIEHVRAPAEQAVPTADSIPVPDAFSGLALPADAALEVVLPATGVAGGVTLRVADESVVRVRSSDPATAYAVSPGVLGLATDADSVELEVTLPEGLPGLVVRLGARVVVRWPSADAARAAPPGDAVRTPFGGR
ncbi:MAG TPA: hypothetical protein VK849_06985 [Longimicrobiales bacterium]|nr:hypothetical protein [Longimicrobiales bacterium]